jgi:hypothetical protein
MVHPSKDPLKNSNTESTDGSESKGLASWLVRYEASNPQTLNRKAATQDLASAFSRTMNLPGSKVNTPGLGKRRSMRLDNIRNQGKGRDLEGKGEKNGQRKGEFWNLSMPKSVEAPLDEKRETRFSVEHFQQVEPPIGVLGPKYNIPSFTSMSAAFPPFIPSLTTFGLPTPPTSTSSSSTSPLTTPPYSNLPQLAPLRWCITQNLTRTHLTHILHRITSELNWDFFSTNFATLFPRNVLEIQAWQRYHLPLYTNFLSHVTSKTTYNFISVFGGDEYESLERFKRFIHDLMVVFSDVKGSFVEEIESLDDRATLDSFLRAALVDPGTYYHIQTHNFHQSNIRKKRLIQKW